MSVTSSLQRLVDGHERDEDGGGEHPGQGEHHQAHVVRVVAQLLVLVDERRVRGWRLLLLPGLTVLDVRR